ncbi:hypothetical protein DM01DRAFT_1390461 [Hesseltinella vesiculosa]|uniref:Uncharacterized protein n=1 Tax=Hesseltinella vesiculosa TaxID=101127 RepID=A0A1X2GI00_9FUNG|nr:hypothetical protein DM01DRAFT_1390461 [Hesseltinella vesiculosa]
MQVQSDPFSTFIAFLSYRIQDKTLSLNARQIVVDYLPKLQGAKSDYDMAMANLVSVEQQITDSARAAQEQGLPLALVIANSRDTLATYYNEAATNLNIAEQCLYNLLALLAHATEINESEYGVGLRADLMTALRNTVCEIDSKDLRITFAIDKSFIEY